MSHKDTMQAVVAALIFGHDIGLAAFDGTSELYPGGGSIVRVSVGARKILAEAERIAREVEPRRGYGTLHYDLVKEVVPLVNKGEAMR